MQTLELTHATETAPGPGPTVSIDRRGRDRLLSIVFATTTAAGAIGLVIYALEGHNAAGYGSYAPWGLWIALYFHGVGIAAGAFVVAAVAYLLGQPPFKHPAALRVAVALSLATILPSFLAVFLDLGRLERAYRIFLSPNFTSMMAFNSWMYGVLVVLLGAVWWLSFRPASEWLRPLLIAGSLLVLMVPSQSGAFFGVVGAKPFWHSAVLPILFLTSAITTGTAMLLLARGLLGIDDASASGHAHRAALPLLRIVTLVGLGVYFLLEFAEMSIALWNPLGHAEALQLVLFGPYWWVFWIVHLGLGGLVPLLLLISQRPGAWMIASLLIAVAFVSGRLNVLVPGQAIPELRGLEEAFVHERLTHFYEATAMEYLIGALLVAMGMAIFFTARWLERRVAARFGAEV